MKTKTNNVSNEKNLTRKKQWELNYKVVKAAENGDLEQVQQLIGRKADVNASIRDNYFTVLMTAAKHGHLAIVQYLLEQNAGVNLTRNNGYTALILASLRDDNALIVKTLLEHCANPNAVTDYGYRALVEASKYANLKVAQHLLEYGADVNGGNRRNRYTALNKVFYYLDNQEKLERNYGIKKCLSLKYKKLGHLLILNGATVKRSMANIPWVKAAIEARKKEMAKFVFKALLDLLPFDIASIVVETLYGLSLKEKEKKEIRDEASKEFKKAIEEKQKGFAPAPMDVERGNEDTEEMGKGKKKEKGKKRKREEAVGQSSTTQKKRKTMPNPSASKTPSI